MIDSTQISVEKVALHYDELDLFYREVWGDHVHHGYWKTGAETPEQATIALIELMAEKLRLKAAMKVCDIGCGYGATSRYLAQHYSCQMQSLTISKNQYQYAKNISTLDLNPIYLLQDWMRNSLTSNSLDAAFSIESSEHMPDFARFFSEAHRVLKPGGKLAIFAWLQSPAIKPWIRKHMLQPLCDEGRMRLATCEEYNNQIKINGFNLVSFDDLSDSVSRTWTLCIRKAFFKILTERKYQSYLLSNKSRNREFAKSLIRIRLAFAAGALHYGLFVAEKI